MKQTLIFMTILLAITSCGTAGRLKFVSVKNADAPVHSPIKELQLSKKEITKKISLESDPCDTLYLISGDVILAEIKSSGREKVHYKKCDEQIGGEYSVRKTELSAIHYSSGTILNYSEDGTVTRSRQTKPAIASPEKPVETKKEEKDEVIQPENLISVSTKEKEKNEGIAAWIERAGWLSFIPAFGVIFSFNAIIGGTILLKKTENYSDHGAIRERAEKGRALGTTSLVTGFIISVLITAIILIIVFA